MMDCACIAGITALKHFRRPEVEVVGDEVTIVCLHSSPLLICPNSSIQHPPSERAPVPLSLHHTPYCLTFAYFAEPGTPSILDPARLEQTLSTGTISIALNAQRELCVVQKAGGVPMEQDEIMRIINVGIAKVKDLDALVETRLKEDWAGRVVEVR